MATERRNYDITSHTSIHVYADETQVDIANNRSYISTELWIYGSSYSAYNVDCNVTGGGGYTNSHLTANGWVKLVSGGFWAPHNADGTGSATVGSYYSSGYGNMPYGEFTLTLSTIPRASQPSINTYPNNSPDITAGVACTIHMNKHANFTHKVSYSFGKKSGVIATGVVDNCSWTPPTSLLDQIGTATVGYGGISVETYSGSTKIGETKTCNFNLHVPNDSNPIIGDISLVEQHEGVKAKNANVTVQQISKKLVSVQVSAKYSAIIKTVTCDGVTLSNNNGTYTGYISNKSNGTYKITVTDSRGLQSSNAVEQTFYEYAKPFITATLKRESETSSKGALSVSGSYSTILSNTLSMTIQRNDSSSPTTVSPSLSNGSISYSKSYADLNYVQSFTVKVKATDGFGESVEATAVLGVGQYALWMGKYNVKVGGKLNVGSDLTVGGAIIANGGISAANYRYKGASPAMHYVASAWHSVYDGGIKVQMNSTLSGHRFTQVDVYDPEYIESVKDDGGYPSARIKKKGRYLLPTMVRGTNVSGNSSYGFGFTINKTDNSGEWGWNQIDIRFTSYSCGASAAFVIDLKEGDIIRYQVFSDLTRTCEYLQIGFIYLTDQ
jgi:hypothetical protein